MMKKMWETLLIREKFKDLARILLVLWRNISAGTVGMYLIISRNSVEQAADGWNATAQLATRVY